MTDRASLLYRAGEPRWVRCFVRDDLAQLVYFNGRYRPPLAPFMDGRVPHYGLLWIPAGMLWQETNGYSIAGWRPTAWPRILSMAWAGTVPALGTPGQRPYDNQLGEPVEIGDLERNLARAVRRAYTEIWRLPPPGDDDVEPVLADVVNALRKPEVKP